jgi:hypothetical protein
MGVRVARPGRARVVVAGRTSVMPIGRLDSHLTEYALGGSAPARCWSQLERVACPEVRLEVPVPLLTAPDSLGAQLLQTLLESVQELGEKPPRSWRMQPSSIMSRKTGLPRRASSGVLKQGEMRTSTPLERAAARSEASSFLTASSSAARRIWPAGSGSAMRRRSRSESARGVPRPTDPKTHRHARWSPYRALHASRTRSASESQTRPPRVPLLLPSCSSYAKRQRASAAGAGRRAPDGCVADSER